MLNFFISVLLILTFLSELLSTKVEVKERKLLVNGEPFVIKGVCYSPTPVGASPVRGYRWDNDSNTYTTDFPLIKSMGANTIRTYAKIENKDALDTAYSHGLYIIMGFWVNSGLDFSSPTVRANLKNEFIQMVRQWKDHPAVLMWCFGNEVSPGGTGTGQQRWSAWYSLVNEVAQEAKSIDPNRPVSTVNSDIGTIGLASYGSSDSSMTALDCWGVNLYLGKDFKDRFVTLASRTSKPVWIAEFGCDAWNSVEQKEDQDMQAEYIYSQWKHIQNNLSIYSSKICLGGTVFEWSDEWWKSNKGGGTDWTQDTVSDWYNPHYRDTNMNEEWWGITAISSGTYKKSLRKAYYTLKNLWLEAPSYGKLFLKEPQNFPNPFKPGDETYIKFSLSTLPVKIKCDIYDFAGNHICSLSVPEEKSVDYKISWDGKNSNGENLPSGVYMCRIEVQDSSGLTETKFRKILLLK